MSRATLIGILVVGVLAVVIAVFVQRSEREFQRQRRANQTSVGTSGSSFRPNSAYRGFDSGGAVGSDSSMRNQIVGRWTETGNCSNPVEFRADGTSGSGRWSLRGGRLSLIDSDGTAVVEVVSVGTQEMILANISTRRQMTWRRC